MAIGDFLAALGLAAGPAAEGFLRGQFQGQELQRERRMEGEDREAEAQRRALEEALLSLNIDTGRENLRQLRAPDPLMAELVSAVPEEPEDAGGEAPRPATPTERRLAGDAAIERAKLLARSIITGDPKQTDDQVAQILRREYPALPPGLGRAIVQLAREGLVEGGANSSGQGGSLAAILNRAAGGGDAPARGRTANDRQPAARPSLRARIAELKADGASKAEARRILRAEGYEID